MSVKYQKNEKMESYFRILFVAKKMFEFATKNKNIGDAVYWSRSISFWRNKIKGLQNEN